MGNDRLSQFEIHEINWDDEKISRLWNYYSRSSLISNMYFTNVFGKQILLNSGLPLDEKLNVLDFGCGPAFLWDHLRRMNANWFYTGLDFLRTLSYWLKKKLLATHFLKEQSVLKNFQYLCMTNALM